MRRAETSSLRKRKRHVLRASNDSYYKSNRDAIGARAQVDGQVNLVQAGSGYISQHTKRPHFGLGSAAVAKRIHVTWPSGATQVFENLNAGHRYKIVEGRAEAEPAAFKTRAKFTSEPVQPDNRSRAFSTWLLDPVPSPVAHRGPAIVRMDEISPEMALLRRYADSMSGDNARAEEMLHRAPAADANDAEAANQLGLLLPKRGPDGGSAGSVSAGDQRAPRSTIWEFSICD